MSAPEPQGPRSNGSDAKGPDQNGPGMHPFARRILLLLPALIAALWIVGITRFRDLELRLIDYGALFAAAIALQILFRRMRGPGRTIELPPGQNPQTVLILASAVTGIMALLLGGVLEAVMADGDPPVTTPWPLRTLWHGGCAFAAAYCRLLARLQIGGPGRGQGNQQHPGRS